MQVFEVPRRAPRAWLGPERFHISAAAYISRVRARVPAHGRAVHGPHLACDRRGRAPPSRPAETPGGGADLRRVPARHAARPDGSIDAERYPDFARLAAPPPGSRTRTPSTTRPSRRCRRSWTRGFRGGGGGRLPRHPRHIYTLFDGLGYEVVDVESAEALCRRGSARARGPGGRACSTAWRTAGGHPGCTVGSARYASARPTLYLQHALLPHEPWIYLPSGHQSRPVGQRPDTGINGRSGFHDPASPATTSPATCSSWASWTQLGLLLDRLGAQACSTRRCSS